MGSTPLDSPRKREQEAQERSIGQVRANHLTDWLRAQSQQQLPRYEHPTDAVWYEPWNAQDTRGCATDDRGGPSTSVFEEVVESVRAQLCVSNGVGDIAVSEVMLNGPRVLAVVGQLEPSGVAKHVRMNR